MTSAAIHNFPNFSDNRFETNAVLFNFSTHAILTTASNQKGNAKHDNDFCAVSHAMFMRIRCLKKQIQPITHDRTQQNSKHNRNRHIYKIQYIRISALCHAQKCRKQYDHKNIIAGCPRHDHLRNCFLGAIF